MKPIEFFVAVTLIVSGIVLASWIEGKPFRDFKANPDLNLYCNLIDGYRMVDKPKVIDLVDNTWVFTNGSASNCEVK